MKSNNWKYSLYSLLGLLALGLAVPAWAVDKGDFLVRLGATFVIPDEDSGVITGIPGSGVGLGDDLKPGITVAYMVTDHVGVELLGAVPFKHKIKGKGSVSGLGTVGDFKQLPPTLSFQYHFLPKGRIRPYAGVGVNYILFFDEDASSSLEAALGGPTDISIKDSAGLAFQAGFDVDITDDWFFNAAAWYIKNNTTVTLNTAGVIRKVDVDVDPIGVMVGIGRRF